MENANPDHGSEDPSAKNDRMLSARAEYEEVKALIEEDDFYGARKKLQKAVELHPECEKYRKKLAKIEEYLEKCEDEEEEDLESQNQSEYEDDQGEEESQSEYDEQEDEEEEESQSESDDHDVEDELPKSFKTSPKTSKRSEPAASGHKVETSHQAIISSSTRPQATGSVHVLQEKTRNLSISDGSGGGGPGSAKNFYKKAPRDDRGLVELSHGLQVQACYFNKLYPYQLEGINWILDLYMKKQGGILADDMGLGKTIQTIIAISALMRSNVIKNALIVAPPTLLLNWEEEFKKWAPRIAVDKFPDSPVQRRRIITKIQGYGGVLLITYGVIFKQIETLIKKDNGREFRWDYLVLDEAHKIKNPANKAAKALHEIPSKVRLCISGTPVQNNLQELFHLYRWVSNGTLFGIGRDEAGLKYGEFKAQFELPILRSREKDATDRARAYGIEASRRLLKLYDHLFLRRTKDQVLRVTQPGENLDSNSPLSLPPKIDLAVWIQLSDVQIKIYKEFLKSPELKAVLSSSQSPLTQIVILKKLCDHPRILPSSAIHSIIQEKKSLNEQEVVNLLDEGEVTIDKVSDEDLIMESGKLEFCLILIEYLAAQRHRTLLFSQSTKMLDIIQRILVNRGYKLLRIDGRVKKMSERQQMVNDFQTDPSYSLCLLTTQVGGVGLTLTAADRVIIYDPSWNPGIDNQAIDRAYRIGQQKWVYVYRLLTCGSVEEKIYRRQIFKTGLTMQAQAQKEDPTRYFTGQQLKELFVFDDPTKSKTYDEFQELHGHQENVHPQVNEHKDELRQMKNIFNVSEHHLLHSITEPKPKLTPEEQAQVSLATSSVSGLINTMREERDARRDQDHTKRLAKSQKSSGPSAVYDLSSDHEEVHIID